MKYAVVVEIRHKTTFTMEGPSTDKAFGCPSSRYGQIKMDDKLCPPERDCAQCSIIRAVQREFVSQVVSDQSYEIRIDECKPIINLAWVDGEE